MNLNKEVTERYDNWLKISRQITADRTAGEDLLHTVLAQFMENPHRDFIVNDGYLNAYIIRSLTLSYHSNNSRYHRDYRKHKFTELTADIPDGADSTWIGARIDNEVIDDVIRRLNPLDRQLFDLYCQPDFSYEKVSVACDIPITYLRSRVHTITKRLRTYVHRSSDSPIGKNVDLRGV